MNSAQDRENYVKGVFNAPSPSAGQMVSSLATAGLIAYGVNRLLGGGRGRRSRSSERDQSGGTGFTAAQAQAWLNDFEEWSVSKEPYFQAIASRLRESGGFGSLDVSILESKASMFRLNCNSVLTYANTGSFDLVDGAVQRANSSYYEIELKFGPPSDYGFGDGETPTNTDAVVEEDLDELWESMYSEISEVEPQLRLTLLEIRSKLRERHEEVTDRAIELDAIEADLFAAFALLRKAMFQKDNKAVRAIIVDEVQPRIDRIKLLFSDLDD